MPLEHAHIGRQDGHGPHVTIVLDRVGGKVVHIVIMFPPHHRDTSQQRSEKETIPSIGRKTVRNVIVAGIVAKKQSLLDEESKGRRPGQSGCDRVSE